MTAAGSDSPTSGVLDQPSPVVQHNDPVVAQNDPPVHQNDPVRSARDDDLDPKHSAGGSPSNPVVLRDPRAIKALAHPARLAVIDEFFAGRRLTATECAEIAGLSASAMSYHLRALEKWGIVRRSETTGDGRERPWEAAGDRLMVDSAEPRASAAGEAVLVARLLDRERADALNWISGQGEDSSAWYEATAISSGIYWLAPEEAKLLGERIGALLAEFDGRSATRGPQAARRLRVSFSVVPSAEAAADAQPSQESASSPETAPSQESAPSLAPEDRPSEAVSAAGANRWQPGYRRIRRI